MAMEFPVVRPHRIELKKSEGSQIEEGPAYGSNVFPGMYLEKVPDLGEGDNEHDRAPVRPHSNVGGKGEALFALEDAYQGKTILDAYKYDPAGDGSLPGDPVQYIVALPGDLLFLLVEGAANYRKGDALESAGNGKLRIKADGYPGDSATVATVEENLDLTTESDAHIRARIVM